LGPEAAIELLVEVFEMEQLVASFGRTLHRSGVSIPSPTTRSAALKQMLLDRRHDLLAAMRTRAGDRAVDLVTERARLDVTAFTMQKAIDLALLRVNMVAEIDVLLARLELGQYGRCVKCEREIAEQRLRVLPFALRCEECEEGRLEGRTELVAPCRRRPTFWLYPNVLDS
jgi:DnaK suppressor protein